MKREFILRRDQPLTLKRIADSALSLARELYRTGLDVCISVGPWQSKRSLEQNRLMWALLTDVAEQVQWHVDGRLAYLTPEDWKDILSAGLTKHQRVAAGIEGGFVLLGLRTSRMTVAQMGELLELIYAFGAQHGVRFHEAPVERELGAAA